MDWIEQLAQIVGPENVHTYLQQRGVTPPPLRDPQATVQVPQPAMAPQMPQNPPQMGLGGAPSVGQGYSPQQLQQAALGALQPAPQPQQTWGDVGKGLIVPLTLGLLTSLGSPRRLGRGTAIATGAANAFNAWAQMQAMQRQQQAAQAQAQARAANVYSRLAQGAATQQHQQQQLAEQTKWHDALTSHYGVLEKQGEQRLTQAQTREERMAERDNLLNALTKAQTEKLPLDMGLTQARLRKLNADEAMAADEPALREALAANAPNDAARAAILNKNMPISQAARFAGVTGRAAADGFIDMMDDEGNKRTMLKSEAIAGYKRGDPLVPWDKAMGGDIEKLKNIRTLVAKAVDAGTKINDPAYPFAGDREMWHYAYLHGGIHPITKQPIDPALGEYFAASDTAESALAGLARQLSGQRAISLYQNIKGHFPHYTDTQEQLLGKSDILNFAADSTLDSMGMPKLVQKPEALNALKEKYNLNRGNDAEYTQAALKAARDLAEGRARYAPGESASTAPTMPAPTTPTAPAAAPRPAAPRTSLPKGMAPTINGGLAAFPRFQVKRKRDGKVFQVDNYGTLMELEASHDIDLGVDEVLGGRDLPDAQPGEDY